MYPYDEDTNLNSENENTGDTEASDETNTEPSEDGSYRMVRPDAGKSFDARQDEEPEPETRHSHDPGYRDANYTSESEGPANYYSPSPSSQRKGGQAEEGAPRNAGGGHSGSLPGMCPGGRRLRRRDRQQPRG